MRPILLDTCALIWLAENEQLSDTALDLLDQVTETGAPTFVSPISAWEIGVLAARGRITLSITPARWFERIFEVSNLQLAAMPPDILIESSFLPGSPPRDPADRIIIATARHYGCTLLTRDGELLDYARQDHISAVKC